MKHRVWKGVAAGMAGGLAGSFVMDQFQSLIKSLSPGCPQQSQQDQESEPATAKAASAISESVFRHSLTPAEKKTAGPAVHYAMGILSGGLYGALADAAPATAMGAGSLFGVGLWLAADEIAVPAFGLPKPATQFPVSTHLNALSSHVALRRHAGLVTPRRSETALSSRRNSPSIFWGI